MIATRHGARGLWVVIFGLLLLAAGTGILLASPRSRPVSFSEPSAVAPPAAPPQSVAVVGGGKLPYTDSGGRLRVRIADREPAPVRAKDPAPRRALS